MKRTSCLCGEFACQMYKNFMGKALKGVKCRLCVFYTFSRNQASFSANNARWGETTHVRNLRQSASHPTCRFELSFDSLSES
jgi:hypothetical protein